MQEATNTPYVKRYHTVDGIVECGNPITKENPYLNDGTNRRNRKPFKGRHMSNKKGISLVIVKDVMPTKDGGVTIFISKVKKLRQFVNAVIKTNRNGKVVKTVRTGKSLEHSVLIN